MDSHIEAIPVFDETGSTILFDMYVNGVWHGSRRTKQQVADYLTKKNARPYEDGRA